MRIIFVRHGHPDYTNDCLTPLGHKHAAAAAKRLKEEGIQQIFSSTCGRAYETAEYTANMLGFSIEKCEFMREIGWGSVDNLPLFAEGHPWSTADAMVAENKSLLEKDWMEVQPFCRNTLVQYVKKIAEDTDKWLETLGYSREGNYYRATGTSMEPEKTVAAFGHGGASAAILAHIFNLPFPFVCTAMGPEYTGITIVTFPEEMGKLVTPRFEILNDARHIQGLQVDNRYDR